MFQTYQTFKAFSTSLVGILQILLIWFSILSMLFSLWAYLTYVLLWTIYIPTVFLISTLPGLHSILSVTLQRNLRPELHSVKTSMQGITAKILPASWTKHDQSTQYISLNVFLQTLLLREQWRCQNICWFWVKTYFRGSQIFHHWFNIFL